MAELGRQLTIRLWQLSTQSCHKQCVGLRPLPATDLTFVLRIAETRSLPAFQIIRQKGGGCPSLHTSGLVWDIFQYFIRPNCLAAAGNPGSFKVPRMLRSQNSDGPGYSPSWPGALPTGTRRGPHRGSRAVCDSIVLLVFRKCQERSGSLRLIFSILRRPGTVPFTSAARSVAGSDNLGSSKRSMSPSAPP